MNYISIDGTIASTPESFFARDSGHTYTSFRLRVHSRYIDSIGEEFTRDDEYTVVCLNILGQFVHSILLGEQIEVVGELHTRTDFLRVRGPINIEVKYPCLEILANTITYQKRLVARIAPDDTVIELYQPDPA